MTSLLPYDLQSLFSRREGALNSSPAVGSQAPSLPTGIDSWQTQGGPGTLVAFVRHCGCPFAEEEVKNLIEASKTNPGLRVVVITHAERDVAENWFREVGRDDFPSTTHPILIDDPSTRLYATWGIGELSWGGLFNLSMLSRLRELASTKGISNRKTGKGSQRWQNSGGFAVDRTGKVTWAKVASDAGDTCDYVKAAESLKA
ncbi:hypothetical protein IE81DRAFT_321286 [Ceraceosorus guamensis]|uniref:Alkyl hydroperoxide reductase subunit C/ Thiol specific antioxidant domain-containing protein n=1 Tax=Ceraceosorus guamensis TaxID=1522189 RepID=A0A316W3W5_9BASI|nr:hypothetical protein IE81DRAFT_321286 [Ceraceosorus guamensis]PWN44392.1 hypothetical protein IE81DRAFT_321286 [Ceraceosorus guamensis]